jgi:hypothetical protein
MQIHHCDEKSDWDIEPLKEPISFEVVDAKSVGFGQVQLVLKFRKKVREMPLNKRYFMQAYDSSINQLIDRLINPHLLAIGY